MSITLNLPPAVETALLAQAESHGLAVDAYVESLVEQARDHSDSASQSANGITPAPPYSGVNSEAVNGVEDHCKKQFRAKIDQLFQRAQELDAQHPLREDPEEEQDPYLQALLEKYQRKGLPLR